MLTYGIPHMTIGIKAILLTAFALVNILSIISLSVTKIKLKNISFLIWLPGGMLFWAVSGLTAIAILLTVVPAVGLFHSLAGSYLITLLIVFGLILKNNDRKNMFINHIKLTIKLSVFFVNFLSGYILFIALLNVLPVLDHFPNANYCSLIFPVVFFIVMSIFQIIITKALILKGETTKSING